MSDRAETVRCSLIVRLPARAETCHQHQDSVG